MSENDAESSKIVDCTPDGRTHRRSTSRTDVVAAREEGLNVEEGRVTWAVTDFTVTKKRKWMFVNGCKFKKPDFFGDRIFKRFHIVAKCVYYLLRVQPSVRMSQRGCHWTHFREI
jgi:hypothetical protein